jgi:hypothetical protein
MLSSSTILNTLLEIEDDPTRLLQHEFIFYRHFFKGQSSGARLARIRRDGVSGVAADQRNWLASRGTGRGAGRGGIVVLVLREAALMIAVGCGVGAGAALTLTGLTRKMLFGITPDDPLVFALAAALLAIAALAAA